MIQKKLYANILFVTVFFLYLVVFFPAFSMLFHKWQQSEEYSHAVFTLPIIVYIIWTKRNDVKLSNGQTNIGLMLITVSVLFYILGLIVQIPTLIFTATYLVVLSIIVYFLGLKALRQLATPLLLLLLLIPLPSSLISALTGSLQLRLSEISSVVIQFAGIPLLREGNILYLPNKTFHVVDACSGIRSLIALSTLSIVIGYFCLAGRLSKFLLVISSLPVALVINIIRVVVLVFVYYFMSIDLSLGRAHEAFGLAIFIAGVALLLGFNGVMQLWEKKQELD